MTVLAEEYVFGRELTVAVLDMGEGLKASLTCSRVAFLSLYRPKLEPSLLGLITRFPLNLRWASSQSASFLNTIPRGTGMP